MSDELLDDTTDKWGHEFPPPGTLPPPIDALSNDPREETPDWLAGSRLNRATAERFLGSHVVFYPGSGSDGHAIKVFGKSHRAHCFVHADLSNGPESILEQLRPDPTLSERVHVQRLLAKLRGEAPRLERPKHVYGYRPESTQVVSPVELMDSLSLDPGHPIRGQDPELRDALWAVLRRDDGRTDEHGPERLAFLHIRADAFWVFWNLWALRKRPPYAVVLHDHDFGGNYARFGGADSPMYRHANPHALPQLLLVADNTEPWPGYDYASDPDPGGMYNAPRRLCRLAQ